MYSSCDVGQYIRIIVSLTKPNYNSKEKHREKTCRSPWARTLCYIVSWSKHLCNRSNRAHSWKWLCTRKIGLESRCRWTLAGMFWLWRRNLQQSFPSSSFLRSLWLWGIRRIRRRLWIRSKRKKRKGAAFALAPFRFCFTYLA